MLVKKPKVSVCVITYNQKQYIRQCLQSIVDQETNFDFEVIVGDDFSTDGTRAIVQEFADKYPLIIRTIYQEKNTGGSKNYLDVHAAASGEYIAHVDGDDYALPRKLQVQSNFLDANSSFNIVWHRILITNIGTSTTKEDLLEVNKFPADGFNRADLLRMLAIGINSSKMYRSSCRDFYLPAFDVMDTFMNVEQIGEGKAGFVDDKPYGVYRRGVGTLSSGKRSSVLLCKTLLYFANKYPKYRLEINTASLQLFLAALKNGRSTMFNFLLLWLRTFHAGSFYYFYKTWHIQKMLRLN